MVFHIVQCSDDFLEVHFTTPWRTEIPTASRIAKIQMAGEDSAAAIEAANRVFDVDVINSIREITNESGWIDALPNQVAGS